MRYPPSFVDRVRQHFLTSEIIGRRVAVRRHGREFQALCPFHKEKSPSFTINDEKGFYHCFGCGAHGDSIKFIQEYEKISYREALERLAGEAGIPLPEFTPEMRAKAARETSLHDVLEWAAKWFQEQLTKSRETQNYLSTRGVSPATQQLFRIGYAPPGRDTLKQAMLKNNFTETQLVDAGLLITPDDGPRYDRFRARLMFPICDLRGKVIAFGGRIMAADAHGPKYLNSPETELFHKGEIFYNAHQARRPAADKGTLIITEGYMDVVALTQAGFPHAVAPLGTAVTPAHLNLAWRITPEPTLCLDGDAAGAKAMLRAAEVALPLLTAGKSLRFVTLPAGEDPDTLIKNRGPAAMEEALKFARPLSQTLWNHYSRGSLSSPEKKSATEHMLMTLTEKIQDVTVKNHYRAYFREQLWPPRKKDGGGAHLETPLAPRLLANSDARMGAIRRERQMARLILLYPSLLEQREVEEDFARLELHDAGTDALRSALLLELHHGDWPLIAEKPGGLGGLWARHGVTHHAETLEKDTGSALPRAVMEAARQRQAHAMLHCWRQLLESHIIAGLEDEYRQTITAMTSNATDLLIARCEEIRRAIDAARQRLSGSLLPQGED